MHILCVNYPYDHEVVVPRDIVTRCHTLRESAQALVAEGAEVTVLQRFHYDAELVHAGVRYVFRTDRCQPILQRRWQMPLRFHRAARDIGANVVHANGLTFWSQLGGLRAALPRESALVAQDHAGSPSRRWSAVQRWCFRGIDGFLFTDRAQALPWQARGVIGRDQPIYEILEGSTTFRWEDRASARARTGLTGAPVVLWVGRLIALKDPLVVLRGFAKISRDMPDARLYMVYSGDAPLLGEVQAMTQGNDRVVLIGERPHEGLEAMYNSADVFVLGSHSEGSGYALIEALACGVIPVVTDIPSFRSITGQGQIGALWRPGDADEFAAAFGPAVAARQPSEAIAAYFRDHLSYPAIARASLRVYEEVVQQRALSLQ